MRTGCRVKKEVVALCYVDDILIRQLTHNPEEIKAAIEATGVGETVNVKDFLPPSSRNLTIRLCMHVHMYVQILYSSCYSCFLF
jgi:hypothetical protein